MLIYTGMKASVSHTVSAKDLADNWGNDLPVLATPVVLWWVELACMQAIEAAMADGYMSAGYRHEMSHLAATPEGWSVRIDVELSFIEGKKLTFDVVVHDGADVIMSGRHIRALVETAAFRDRLARKASGRRQDARVAADG